LLAGPGNVSVGLIHEAKLQWSLGVIREGLRGRLVFGYRAIIGAVREPPQYTLMARLSSERAVVQRPLVRYATEAGWTYIDPEEALRLRHGESSPLLTFISLGGPPAHVHSE
jgi:hypothetical protein